MDLHTLHTQGCTDISTQSSLEMSASLLHLQEVATKGLLLFFPFVVKFPNYSQYNPEVPHFSCKAHTSWGLVLTRHFQSDIFNPT